MSTLNSVWNAITGMVTRAKVSRAQPGTQRTALQITGFQGEIFEGVALLLPYGMSALPVAGADVILLTAGGVRDRKVALCADSAALRITDLAGGEFGFRDAQGQQVVFRSDRLEITSPLKIVLNCTGDLEATIGGAGAVNITGNVALSSSGDITIASPNVALGAAGGRKVVLDGDPVVGGAVRATSTNTTAT